MGRFGPARPRLVEHKVTWKKSFRLKTSCSRASASSLKRAHCDCPGALLAAPGSRRWSTGWKGDPLSSRNPRFGGSLV